MPRPCLECRHSPLWGWGGLAASVLRVWGPPGPQAAAAHLWTGLTGSSGVCGPRIRLVLGSGLRGLQRRALELGAQTHLLLQELSSDPSAPGENKIVLKMISFQTNAPQARASPPLAIQWGSLWVTLSGLGWWLPCLALWLLSPHTREGQVALQFTYSWASQPPGLRRCPWRGRRPSVGWAAPFLGMGVGIAHPGPALGDHSTHYNVRPLPTFPPWMEARRGADTEQRTQLCTGEGNRGQRDSELLWGDGPLPTDTMLGWVDSSV